jgi:hypothetical protein
MGKVFYCEVWAAGAVFSGLEWQLGISEFLLLGWLN